MVETDILIVGTGPAGAGAAALLAGYGIDHIAVNKYGSTAREPRAHITNQRAVEVFRDLGIERELKRYATPKAQMAEHVFCTSLTGEELGRLKAWGNSPISRAGHDTASPTEICDFTQNYWEPVLLTAAMTRGGKVRFHTEYLSLEQDSEGVTATLHDRLINRTYQVRAKYLIGADGARSQVAQDVGLPIEGKMDIAASINIVFEADLTHLVAHRPGVIYWIIQPSAGMSNTALRMVRPWDRWLCTYGLELTDDVDSYTEEQCIEMAARLIDDPGVEIKIESKSGWTINEAYAMQVANGRVFCMGDAIHRHPPNNGLGANTSIQDAYNLCWKLAMVLRGEAGPALLDSYQAERAPIAEQIVKRANRSIREILPIYNTLGALPDRTTEQIQASMDKRKEPGEEGEQVRETLMAAVAQKHYDFDAHGVDMNQRYDSAAIIPDGTPDPGFDRDPELYYQASARPGSHLPHAWLSRKGHAVSTFDLCGRGRFSLLTGIGGEAWQGAARAVEDALGTPIDVHIIGPGQVYEDMYGNWAAAREIRESGALLVRPDHFIAWRSERITDTAAEDLVQAMGNLLGRSI